jgi:hypothetical protein
VHITSASKATLVTRALYAGVSWIGVVLFWWLGASGLGPELVAKPVFFSCAQAVEVGGQFGASTFQ